MALPWADRVWIPGQPSTARKCAFAWMKRSIRSMAAEGRGSVVSPSNTKVCFLPACPCSQLVSCLQSLKEGQGAQLKWKLQLSRKKERNAVGQTGVRSGHRGTCNALPCFFFFSSFHASYTETRKCLSQVGTRHPGGSTNLAHLGTISQGLPNSIAFYYCKGPTYC